MSSNKNGGFDPFSDDHDDGWESSRIGGLQESSSGFGSSNFNTSSTEDPKRVESLESNASSAFSFLPSKRDTKSLQPKTIRKTDSIVGLSAENAQGFEPQIALESVPSLTPGDLEKDRERERKAKKKKKKKKRDSLTNSDNIGVENMPTPTAVVSNEAFPETSKRKESEASYKNTAMNKQPVINGRPVATAYPSARKTDSYVEQLMTGQKRPEPGQQERSTDSRQLPTVVSGKGGFQGRDGPQLNPSVSSRSPTGAFRVAPAPGSSSSSLLPGNEKALSDGTSFPDYLVKLGFEKQSSQKFADDSSHNLSETNFKVHPEYASNRRNIVAISIGILLIIGGIACGIAYCVLRDTKGGKQHNQYSRGNEGGKRNSLRMKKLMDRAIQISGREVLEDDGSPQSLAIQWMAEKDIVWDNRSSISQRYVAVVLFHSFDMLDRKGSLNGWLDEMKHECDWAPSLTCDENKTITELQLPGDDLEGIIPNEIGMLTNLKNLILNNNTLVGSIPKAVGRLTLLETLIVGNNMLTGEIPPEIGLLSVNLRIVDISGNHLHGEIPLSFFRATNLETVEVSRNRIEGTFPNQINKLINLKKLSLGSNRIEGFLPHSLHTLSTLETLKAEDNRISGTFPHDKAFLSRLHTLSLSSNQIEGTLPQIWDLNVTNLHTFEVANNKITGTLPKAFSEMITLRKLDVGNNYMTGSIPGFFGMDIEIAIFSSNEFSGGLSRRIGTNLRYVDYSWNKLKGPITAKLELARDLKHLDFSGNTMLTGTIPDEIGQLRFLEHLDLNGCSFTGQIPGALTLLGYLRFIDLNNNELDGSLPLSLCSNKVPTINFTVPCTATCGCCRQHCGDSRHLRVR